MYLALVPLLLAITQASWLPAKVRAAGYADPPAYLYRKALTFNTSGTGAAVATSQTNFPIAVHINASAWPAGADRTAFFGAWNIGGKRIQFFDPGDTPVGVTPPGTGAVRSSNTVTVTTQAAHGLAAADRVVLRGVVDPSFNGTFTVATVPSSTSFTFAQTGANAISGKGTARRTLAYEVEYYDSASTEALYWVKVPQVDGNSTTDSIWLDYGNDPYGADQDNKASVWSNGFVAVWHLGDNSWGTSPEAKDSAGANNGTNVNSTDAAGAGRRGRAVAGNTSSYIQFPNAAAIKPAGPMTLSTWLYMTVNPAGKVIISKYAGVPCEYELGVSNASPFNFFFRGDSSAPASYYTSDTVAASTYLNSWVHLVGTYDTRNHMYVNASQKTDSAVYTRATTRTDVLDLGMRAYPGAEAPWAGTLDETRLSNVARSADWVRLEYFSLKKTNWNGDAWLTWSAQQVPL